VQPFPHNVYLNMITKTVLHGKDSRFTKKVKDDMECKQRGWKVTNW